MYFNNQNNQRSIKHSLIKELIFGIAVILIFSFFVSYLINRSNNTDVMAMDNSTMKVKSFELSDINGQIFNYEKYVGSPMIINFWTTWCPYCANELADLNKLQTEFSDKIIVIAINRKEAKSEIQSFIKEKNINNNIVFLLDSKDSVYQSINSSAMSETIFVDKKGNIRQRKAGKIDFNEMRDRVSQLLSF